nr:MAG TPA: hypothetical protein [Caudoviricetes sp.]DAI15144.1 MAG TPA: hypothetical protein [Caudoviricetes sp.]
MRTAMARRITTTRRMSTAFARFSERSKGYKPECIAGNEFVSFPQGK